MRKLIDAESVIEAIIAMGIKGYPCRFNGYEAAVIDLIRRHEAARESMPTVGVRELESIFVRCQDIIAFHVGNDSEKVEAIRRTLL